MHNNRGAKKQANRRANREGMDTPPREEPQEEKLKSRVTNLWWFENELRTTDMSERSTQIAARGAFGKPPAIC